MSPESVYTLRIFYTNGSVQTYAYPIQGSEGSASHRIEALRKRDDLALQLADRLVFIPKRSILRIEVSPPPTTSLPDALHDVRLVKDGR